MLLPSALGLYPSLGSFVGETFFGQDLRGTTLYPLRLSRYSNSSVGVEEEAEIIIFFRAEGLGMGFWVGRYGVLGWVHGEFNSGMELCGYC